jgi:hypothetical protein
MLLLKVFIHHFMFRHKAFCPSRLRINSEVQAVTFFDLWYDCLAWGLTHRIVSLITITRTILMPRTTSNSTARALTTFYPRRPGLASRSVHVAFVVDKVALGQVFLRALRVFPVNIISSFLHIYLYII